MGKPSFLNTQLSSQPISELSDKLPDNYYGRRPREHAVMHYGEFSFGSKASWKIISEGITQSQEHALINA